MSRLLHSFFPFRKMSTLVLCVCGGGVVVVVVFVVVVVVLEGCFYCCCCFCKWFWVLYFFP